MYVVLEWNQASGRPKVAVDDVFDDEVPATEEARRLDEEARQLGRGERYTVHPLGESEDR